MTEGPSSPGPGQGRAEPPEDFFEPELRSELEALAATPTTAAVPAVPPAPHETFAAFLAPPPGETESLSEEGFLALSTPLLAERTNALIDICRRDEKKEAGQAIESFIVFFQALAQTLAEDGAREVKRLFFRLVPLLIHIVYSGLGDTEEERGEARAALRSLETILIEISSVRLAPSESDLVSRSIDTMAALIGVGQYAMANEMISSQLLSIISRNKIARALYRLMQVEVNVQVYLKGKLGYSTPQIRVPDDFPALADYGPIRILREESPSGGPRWFIQVQLPDIPTLREVVLRLVAEDGRRMHDLRLDALGSAELDVPKGTYTLGWVYEPEEPSRTGAP